MSIFEDSDEKRRFDFSSERVTTANEPSGSPSPIQVGSATVGDASLDSGIVRGDAAAALVALSSTAALTSAAAPASDADVGLLSQVDTSLIRLDQFRADPRFSGIDGHGLSVVVIDTGIDLNHSFFGPDANHDGVADRISYSYDFSGSNDPDASDFNGHGSNVASIIGSQDGTYTGMAPGVNIIALKVFPDSGRSAFTSDIAEALNWVVANRAAYNVVSVNMSLGYGDNLNAPTSSPFANQIATLAANNTAVVVASGNDYASYQIQGVSTPSADPNAWSIGAVWDRNAGGFSWVGGATDYSTGPDRIISFSQRSTSMTTVFAPGGQITGANWNGGLSTYSGTSQATPHVAGLVADMQQLALQVSGHLLSLSQLKQTMISGSVSIYDGDDENDNVANTFSYYRRVDALGWGYQVLAELFAGTSGSDNLNGTAVMDTIHGGAGDDTLNGFGGDDILDGGTGNDLLIGGSGVDTFYYALGYGGDTVADFTHSQGDKINLTAYASVHSLFQVLSRAGQAGADTIINFGGGDLLTLSNVSKAALVADDFTFLPVTMIESVGWTSLARVGNTYFLDGSGGSSGPQVRYLGAPVTAGQFGGWAPIGAEQFVGAVGYQVVWKFGNADQYSVWTTDSGGNDISGTAVSGASYAVQSLETSFGQDLNSDGTIGVVSSAIEAAGATKLANVADMYFMYQGSGASGVLVRYGGVPFAAGQFGGWRAIGAEQMPNGYSVWWRNGPADQYVMWNTDLGGNFFSNGAVVSGASYAVQSYEAYFQQDLNSDGTIGVISSVIETAGTTKLARVADMYFMYQGSGATGVVLRNGGDYVVAGASAWTPLGVEQSGSGYQVVFKNGSADEYVLWTTDSNGNCLSSGSVLMGASAALTSLETTFGQDFNSSGTVGSSEPMVSSSGATGAGGSITLLASYMASTFATPAGQGTGVVVDAQSPGEEFLAKPAA